MEKLFAEQAEYFASLQWQPPDPQVMLELSKNYGIPQPRTVTCARVRLSFAD